MELDNENEIARDVSQPRSYSETINLERAMVNYGAGVSPRKPIQSGNYKEEISGYKIDTNGNVEFTDGIFRGDVEVGGAVTVADEAYGVGWNASLEVPTKNAVYDKIEGLSSVYQPLDSDLTTIAGLTATTDNFIVSVASAWASRTPTQVRTTLGLGTAALVNTDLSDLNEATIETAIDTLANLTSIQGRTVTLADAGANAIFGWDDTAGAYENLTQGEVRAVAGLATTDSPEFAAVNIGAATDTTITRVSAGVIAVEGKTLVNLTDGGTFAADISVPDEAYGVGWNGSVEVPTKNAVYDKIETLGAATTCLTTIPLPLFTTLFSTAAVTGFTLNTNTTQYLALVVIPFKITANKITTYWSTTTVDGTVDITLYAEDGQSQIFSVTTASLTGTDFLESTALSAVVIPAGNYYLGVNTNGTADLVGFAWNYNTTPTPFGTTNGIFFDVASEPKYQGTLTITAGTPATTFDPTALTESASDIALLVRLDN